MNSLQAACFFFNIYPSATVHINTLQVHPLSQTRSPPSVIQFAFPAAAQLIYLSFNLMSHGTVSIEKHKSILTKRQSRYAMPSASPGNNKQNVKMNSKARIFISKRT